MVDGVSSPVVSRSAFEVFTLPLNIIFLFAAHPRGAKRYDEMIGVDCHGERRDGPWVKFADQRHGGVAEAFGRMRTRHTKATGWVGALPRGHKDQRC